MSTSTTSSPSARPGVRKALWITLASLLLVLFAILAAAWISFRAKAEGITIGYLQAANAAFQMGRPIPDSIFEAGFYRIEVKSQGGTDKTPVVITVYVKDRFMNQVFFEESRSVGIPTAR